jgi:hypothetical protein
MNNLKHLGLLATLILIAATSSVAQEQKPEVIVEYKRFDNMSQVRLRPMLIAESATDQLSLGASFGNSGSLIRPSNEASIHFVSFSKEWQYITDHSLILLIDGERLPLITIYYEKEISRGLALESMAVEVSYNTLVRIASAKKVEGRLGQREFELPKGVLEGLKELARRMKQPQ